MAGTSIKRVNWTAVQALAELIAQYLIGLSECKHGLSWRSAACCLAPAPNDPNRWGYEPDQDLEYNQIMFEAWQAERVKAGIRASAKDKAAKQELGYVGPAMRVDRRPINARVRAVHASKLGQVNVKELGKGGGLVSSAYGAGRYSDVMRWGRKYCPQHGVYEKRLK